MGAIVRDRRGAALPMMVAGLIPMIGAVGSAIDLGRIYVSKSQMQAGVDAAALAGARAFGITDGSDNDRSKQVAAYFKGNFPDGYMGMATVTPVPTFTTTNGVNQTIVNATDNLPMTFLSIFGVKSRPISVVAQAQLQPRPLEVMVVLDNTGSMNGNLDGSNTSMDALKISMHNFLSVLYQGATARADLALGIINYTITTNVGDILKKFGVPIQSMQYFTDYPWPNYPLAWKGCVADDPTHMDMSSDLAVKEADAFDIQRTLPGDGKGMPAITPFFYPPTYVPNASDDTGKASGLSNFYNASSVEYGKNLYALDPFNQGNYALNPTFSTLANSSLYKPYFYKLYIGLNDSASNWGDDVVVRVKADGTYAYLDPATITDPRAQSGSYAIRISLIPNLSNTSLWKPATAYDIVSTKTGHGYNGLPYDQNPNPTPNWQCPNAGMEVAYGRQKTAYDTFIDNEVAPIQPANGTQHHIGFLWGYRLLVRDDVFTRSNPTTEQPKRALIFMTDGVSALSEPGGTPTSTFLDRVNTAYGTVSDNKLLSVRNNVGTYQTAVELRFRKTCQAAQLEANPPVIYIVALNRGGSDMNANTRAMFKACASGGYYETTSTTALNSAFTEIATDLVDLHLTK